MKRILFWPSSTILLLGVLVLPACGQQDSAQTVLADCSGHIPHEKVDSCLERARVFDETNPSPDLQALEAELQRRALHHEEAQEARAQGYDPNERPQDADDPDQGPPPGYDRGQPPAGYNADQPPQGYDPNQPPPQSYGQPPPPPPPGGDEGDPSEGPRGDVSPPVDPTGPGDLSPPEPQGPPPDNTPPPDDETQGPG